jgi:hypothetical protein
MEADTQIEASKGMRQCNETHDSAPLSSPPFCRLVSLNARMLEAEQTYLWQLV